MTADDIVKLLASKHSEDVFISECKTGPSMCVSGCPRMDAWAMKRSWSTPRCIAYEVKVSRADFLQDHKWMEYLPYCNEFAFVTAPGVIKTADEIPPDAGWMVATKTGSRTLTKKKAPYRDITIPEELFRYLIMRARSFDVNEFRCRNSLEAWREWLKEKEENREVGRNVSRSLSRLVQERITKVEVENRRLVAENNTLSEVRKLCETLGLNSHHIWNAERELKEKMAVMRGGPLVKTLSIARGTIENAIKAIGEDNDL